MYPVLSMVYPSVDVFRATDIAVAALRNLCDTRRDIEIFIGNKPIGRLGITNNYKFVIEPVSLDQEERYSGVKNMYKHPGMAWCQPDLLHCHFYKAIRLMERYWNQARNVLATVPPTHRKEDRNLLNPLQKFFLLDRMEQQVVQDGTALSQACHWLNEQACQQGPRENFTRFQTELNQAVETQRAKMVSKQWQPYEIPMEDVLQLLDQRLLAREGHARKNRRCLRRIRHSIVAQITKQIRDNNGPTDIPAPPPSTRATLQLVRLANQAIAVLKTGLEDEFKAAKLPEQRDMLQANILFCESAMASLTGGMICFEDMVSWRSFRGHLPHEIVLGDSMVLRLMWLEAFSCIKQLKTFKVSEREVQQQACRDKLLSNMRLHAALDGVDHRNLAELAGRLPYLRKIRSAVANGQSMVLGVDGREYRIKPNPGAAGAFEVEALGQGKGVARFFRSIKHFFSHRLASATLKSRASRISELLRAANPEVPYLQWGQALQGVGTLIDAFEQAIAGRGDAELTQALAGYRQRFDGLAAKFKAQHMDCPTRPNDGQAQCELAMALGRDLGLGLETCLSRYDCAGELTDKLFIAPPNSRTERKVIYEALGVLHAKRTETQRKLKAAYRDFCGDSGNLFTSFVAWQQALLRKLGSGLAILADAESNPAFAPDRLDEAHRAHLAYQHFQAFIALRQCVPLAVGAYGRPYLALCIRRVERRLQDLWRHYLPTVAVAAEITLLDKTLFQLQQLDPYCGKANFAANISATRQAMLDGYATYKYGMKFNLLSCQQRSDRCLTSVATDMPSLEDFQREQALAA